MSATWQVPQLISDRVLQQLLSGDPAQLPPFVEPGLNRDNLGIRSMIDLAPIGDPNKAVVLIDQQRMHPDIRVYFDL
jgi:hypothetical protein